MSFLLGGFRCFSAVFRNFLTYFDQLDLIFYWRAPQTQAPCGRWSRSIFWGLLWSEMMVSDVFQLFTNCFQLFYRYFQLSEPKIDYFPTMKPAILTENHQKTWQNRWNWLLLVRTVGWSISIIFRCFSASFRPFSAISDPLQAKNREKNNSKSFKYFVMVFGDFRSK